MKTFYSRFWLLLILLCSVQTLACDCVWHGLDRTDYLRQNTVQSAYAFLARVESVEQKEPGVEVATLSVQKIWKQPPGSALKLGDLRRTNTDVRCCVCGRSVSKNDLEIVFSDNGEARQFSSCSAIQGFQETDRAVMDNMMQIGKRTRPLPPAWVKLNNQALSSQATIIASHPVDESSGDELLLWGENIRVASAPMQAKTCDQKRLIDGPELIGRWRVSVREKGQPLLKSTLFIQGPSGETELSMPDFRKQASWRQTSAANKQAFQKEGYPIMLSLQTISKCQLLRASIRTDYQGQIEAQRLLVIGAPNRPYDYFEADWHEGIYPQGRQRDLRAVKDFSKFSCTGKDTTHVACLRADGDTVFIGVPPR
jgi:hypothetical protein